jgi:(R,R)-butanediol dehydrogenase/meso-butanediol dehydrogenase/diacetyl reductase
MNNLLIPLSESISFEEGATTEPLATSLHGVNLAKPADGETHVIMGAGIIGLGVLQGIKYYSSAKVIVVDLSDKRLEMARSLGADITINAAREDVVETILGITGSQQHGVVEAIDGNVDTVFDCAGVGKNFEGTSVLAQSLSLVKQNGKVIVVAIFEKSPEIDYNIVVRKGIQIMGSWAWTPEEFKQAAELISSGKIDRKPLISHTFSLEDASEAYETQLRAEEAVKVILKPV